MDSTDNPSRLVTPAELAQRWGVSRAHVYALMNRGLPSLTLGRARRIRVADAEDWLDGLTIEKQAAS